MRSKYILTSQNVFICLQIIYVLAHFFVRDIRCMLPEASQEGTLHPFKSYGDVTTFHYTVPKEVFRATWQFAAFTDNLHCPSRKVHLHLKSGSYPVMSVNNASFPANMHLYRNDTISVSMMTTFEPKVTATIPVYGPEPGDWFVTGYLSHWDKKVQQQGLGHKCRYTLGSVAIWTQTSGIQDIPIGTQKFLHTNEPMSYYKIYIPSSTWHFRVHVWGCNFTLRAYHDSNTPCIKGLALKGRTIPIYNESHPSSIGNLTISDSYTFTILSPYQESYYYLLVISGSVIDFNVMVSISECPIRMLDKSFMKQYLDAPSFSEALNQLRVKNKEDRLRSSKKQPLLHQIFYNNSTLNYDSMRPSKDQFVLPDDDDARDDPCIPRFQLARIKHSQPFSSVYLLQGREWLTSWVMLTDYYPVVTQFDIMPFIDIGGTLSIEIRLEMNKQISDQLVLVEVCIRKGRVPDRINGEIVCQNQNMFMNLSSYGKNISALLIPYPESDVWHVAMQAKCYTEGRKAPCTMEEILVSVDIKTRQCVFPGVHSCGNHGICQETKRGLLYYTSCNCFGGYKGWGCTDSTHADPKAFIVLTTLLLTLSNGFFIPAIYLAIKRGLYTEALVYLATMIFSSLYHACDQQFMTYCAVKYEVLQYSDFFSSILAFWVTLVSMAKLPTKYVSFFHMIGVLVIAFCVETDRTGLTSILVPLAMGATIPIAAFACRCYKYKQRQRPKEVVKLIIGLSLATIGLLLFALVETESNYQYVHSVWHAVIALSLLFLLPNSAEPEPLEISINDTSSSDSELMDYKDLAQSPVFTVKADGEKLLTVESDTS
ncbi:post-GPI attachment to proteins factor 6-like isoform X1 [Neodiprion fabricii]|uniref:post-GPI attachment to proteins factor 6-like isoform X1 n=1 Tax=Neodiprion fabricii TaxID=2872261 RepID=UPI001ED90354|nr:post-GPI attachment to proteins factor 6-like isoform X1 [Neodiprion fabricii]